MALRLCPVVLCTALSSPSGLTPTDKKRDLYDVSHRPRQCYLRGLLGEIGVDKLGQRGNRRTLVDAVGHNVHRRTLDDTE